MRKLSAKKKVKKGKSQDEDAPLTPDANVEANENGGKNEESSGNESDNSKTVKRKSRKNAEKDDDADNVEENEDEADEEKEKEDDSGEEEAEPEYEVQNIVDKKIEKGVTYYLIRWKGYGPNDDTWEAEDTLNCPDIIAKFKKKAEKGSSSNASEKSPKGKRGRKRKAEAEDGKEEGEPTDPDKEWEVVKIIDVGYDKGIRLFRIRWKGYTSKYDTWEPEEHLNCTDLIEKFLANMANKRNSNVDQKELREQPKRTQRLTADAYRRGSKRNAGKTRAVYYEGDD